MKRFLASAAMAAGLALGGANASAAPDAKQVLTTYADIAHAVYEDSLLTANVMRAAIGAFVQSPTPGTLAAARASWIAARIPYQQSEAYRFGNPVVDDWEGKVNAWPLDEGLIDYVSGDYGTESDENPYYAANVIANRTLKVGGASIDASTINVALLQSLHEVDEVEANVATGYHAIEFLLWGQDLNGTGSGAGDRPASDFSTRDCTGGNCQRRIDYLLAATDLLIQDLEFMVGQWAPAGNARKELLAGDANEGLSRMLTGMGSLSYGELAGERMKLGLMLHDPEEEHDCFADNTHDSHYYDAVGIENVYLGRYRRVDGSMVGAASLSDLVAARSPEADKILRSRLTDSLDRLNRIRTEARQGRSYDQLIGADNAAGNRIVDAAVNALKAQTKAIETVVAALDLKPIEVEGSDSLDAPQKVGN